MVIALCKLHNFCINESDVVGDPIVNPENFVTLEECDDTLGSSGIPRELLDGGHHFNDLPRNRQQFSDTPRDKLYLHICNHRYERPTPL